MHLIKCFFWWSLLVPQPMWWYDEDDLIALNVSLFYFDKNLNWIFERMRFVRYLKCNSHGKLWTVTNITFMWLLLQLNGNHNFQFSLIFNGVCRYHRSLFHFFFPLLSRLDFYEQDVSIVVFCFDSEKLTKKKFF